MSFTTNKQGKHPLGSHPMGREPHSSGIDLELVDIEIPIRGRTAPRTVAQPRQPMMTPGIDLTEVRHNIVSSYGIEPLNIRTRARADTVTSHYETEPPMAAGLPTGEPVSEALPERPGNCLVRFYRRLGRCRRESCPTCTKVICCIPDWAIFIVVVVGLVIATAILTMHSRAAPRDSPDHRVQEAGLENVIPPPRLH